MRGPTIWEHLDTYERTAQTFNKNKNKKKNGFQPQSQRQQQGNQFVNDPTSLPEYEMTEELDADTLASILVEIPTTSTPLDSILEELSTSLSLDLKQTLSGIVHLEDIEKVSTTHSRDGRLYVMRNE